DPRRPALLRPGAIAAADLARVLGRRFTTQSSASASTKNAGQIAPGMLARHYSPRTPVSLHPRISTAAIGSAPPTAAFILLRRPRGAVRSNVFSLDPHGKLSGVARRLFATLRTVDALKFQRIHVELARGTGLAVAINDRLRRAAAR